MLPSISKSFRSLEEKSIVIANGRFQHGVTAIQIIQCEAAVQNPAFRNIPQSFRVCAETNPVRKNGKAVAILQVKNGECPVCQAIEEVSGGGSLGEGNDIFHKIEIVSIQDI